MKSKTIEETFKDIARDLNIRIRKLETMPRREWTPEERRLFCWLHKLEEAEKSSIG
jgi:hypothetical protein